MNLEINTHLIVVAGRRGFQHIPQANFVFPPYNKFHWIDHVRVDHDRPFQEERRRLGTFVEEVVTKRRNVTVVGTRLEGLDTGPIAAAQLVTHRGITVYTLGSEFPQVLTPGVEDPHAQEGLRWIHSYFPMHNLEVQQRLHTVFLERTLEERRTLPGAQSISMEEFIAKSKV